MLKNIFSCFRTASLSGSGPNCQLYIPRLSEAPERIFFSGEGKNLVAYLSRTIRGKVKSNIELADSLT